MGHTRMLRARMETACPGVNGDLTYRERVSSSVQSDWEDAQLQPCMFKTGVTESAAEHAVCASCSGTVTV